MARIETTDPRTGKPCILWTPDGEGPPPPPPIEHDARHRMWRELNHCATLVRGHISQMQVTEPPAWGLLTHREIEGLTMTFQNLALRLLEYRLRADVDNGPMNGRNRGAE